MPYCFTNISDPARVAIYKRAIEITGLPLWIGEADRRGLPGWHGLWSEKNDDISKFWRAVEELDAAQQKTAANGVV